MLGRVNPQRSLLEPGQLFGHLVTKGSFYENLARCGHELICDDDFAHLYAPSRGRPSIPPSVMMRALLLATKDGTSDRESARRSRVDLDWKAALGLDTDHPGIGATTLSLFRARIVLHDADQALFRKTVAKAVEAELFPTKVLALIDSSPVLGAGAVKDTYELVRSAMRRVVAAAGEDALSKSLRKSLRRYEAKPVIDWDDPEARARELSRMVTAATKLLAAVAERDEAREAAALLAAIVAQDVEIDEDSGEPRIRTGVAKDRIVSASDPEMRHGRKSSSTRFDGHKLHVMEEESTEIILGIDVGAGNGADNEHAAPLIEGANEAGVEVQEVVGDMAYSDGDTREAVEAHGAKMIAKVRSTFNAGCFPKTDFLIDPELLEATCPAGEVSTDARPGKDYKGRRVFTLFFEPETCASCAIRSECVRGTGARSITLNVHEARLIKARAEQQRPSVKAKLRRRAVIERKIDHLHDLGARKALYRGRRKTKLQALLAATVANFARLEVLGGLGRQTADPAGRGSTFDRLRQCLRGLHSSKSEPLASLRAFLHPIHLNLQRTTCAFSDALCCSLT